MSKHIAGINIQFPISTLILSGKKTIETRTYPLPKKYVGKEMAFIETPGRDGKFKARVIAIVVFGESFQYSSKKQFYEDSKRHFITVNSVWKWTDQAPKWGWPILKVTKLSKHFVAPKKKGIKFTCSIPIRGY